MSEQFLSDADFFGSEPLLSDDDFFGSEPAAAASGGDVPGLAEYQEKPLGDRAISQLQSGWETLKQAGQATFAKSGMTSLQVMDRIDRGEPVTMMEDPAGYADMSPEDRAALRQQSAQGVAMNLGRMAESAETQANLPRNPAADALVQRANAGDWSGAWNAFTADPLGVTQQFAVESLPLAAPSLAAGLATAPVGGLPAFLTGLAAGSYPVEYGASLIEGLREAGVDVRDTAAVQAKMSDPAFLKQIGERANTRGTVIAAADAAGGALAAPLRAGQAMRNAGIAARNIGAEVGTEMAGEAAAQVASGEEFKAGEVLAEGLGAGPQSVVTTAGRTIAANRAAPAEPVAPPPERIEPYFEAAPGRRATISADDDASPLPNDFIARGKAIIEDTLAGRVEPPALSFDAENTQEPPAQIPQGAVPAETLIGAEPETLLSDEDFFGSAEPVTPAETFLTDEDIFGPAEGLKPLYGETGQQTGWVNPATGEEQALTSAAGNGEPRVNRGGLAPDGPLPSLEVPQPVAGEMNVGGAGPSVEPIGDGSQASPVVVQTADDIARAESQVAEPTEAQKESGNYRKAHLKLAGLDISIENPKDSIRSGTAPDGTTWQTKMPAAYGYIRRTEGADGDQFDVYLGPQPEAGTVFIVDQIDPKTGKFDEHKGLIGFVTQEEALRAYDGGFSDGSGPSRRGAVTAMPMDQFKDLVRNGDTTKALSYKQSTVAANDDATAEAAQRFALPRNIPVPPANKQDNIRRGNRAIDSVIRDQTDEPYAVHRPEIGWVDFIWGDEKAGIRHLIERRQSADKMSEQEAIAFAKRLPAAIINGRLGAPYTTDGKWVKRNVMWNDQSIILQATRDGQKGHWVVTGFGGMKAMPERAKMLSKSEVEKMIADATAPGVKVRRDATHSIPNQGLRALQTNPPETAGGPRRSGISDEVGAASDNIIPDETVGNTTESQKNQRDADAERDGPATSRDEKGKPKGEESLRTPAAKEGGTAKYRLTPEFSRYRQSLAGDLQQRLRDVGIADRVSVRLVDSITDYDGSDTEAAGRYTRGLIDVAMGSGAESWVLNHEIVHALRDLDVIRKDEWSTLKRTALADQPRMAEVRERYADLNLTEEDLIEEAVADMFADYIDGTYQPKGFIRTAFTRIRDFIEALGNALRGNGFNSADAIFEAMDNGELARRDTAEKGMTDTKVTALPLATEARYAIRRGKKLENQASEADRAMIEKHFAPAKGGKISQLAKSEFFKDVARDGLADTLITQIVTDLHPIFAYEAKASGGKIRDARVSAAKFAEFTMNDTGRTWSLFHAGPLQYDANEGIVKTVEGSKGLFDIFKYLSDPETYSRFRLYSAARRGQRLMREGRERNLTEAAIERGLELADETGKYGKETRTFRQIFDDYQQFNLALLNGMGRDTGLLNQEQIDLFTEHMDYIPFYREMDEGAAPTTAWIKKKIDKPDPRIKTLEGGDQRIGDLMENIVHNAMSLTRAGMRNITMRRLWEIADQLGEGQFVTSGGIEDGVLTYRVNGKDLRFLVDDPSLVAAVAAMKPEQRGAFYKALAWMGAFFRNGITMAPSFMLKNLIRGTTAGFVQTGKNISLANNTATGFWRAITNARSIQELKAISGTGAYTFGGDTADIAARARRKIGAEREAMPVSVIKRLFQALEFVGEATELADRDAIYNNMLKKGATKAEAAYQAMNLINYSRKGKSEILRWLLPLIPFLNARIQGLYRMAETQTSGAEKRKALLGVAARGLILTAVSTVLHGMFEDDDRYDDEPLHRKLNYYIIYGDGFKVMIPKAFEFGAIFSTIPELMLDAFRKGETKRLRDGLWMTLTNTLGMNPIPQAVMPIIENTANHSFFTGRPLESARLEGYRPGSRYDSGTSDILKVIGDQTNTSPIKLQNILEGYTGTLGMQILSGLDSIARAAGLFNEKPEGPFGGIPIISEALQAQLGSMYKTGPDKSSRWVEEFFDLAKRNDETFKYLQHLREAGRLEERYEILLANQDNVRQHEYISDRRELLGEINARIRKIEEGPYDGETKRNALDRLYARRNLLAKSAMKRLPKPD